MTDTGRVEPEPIETEYEPAEAPAVRRRRTPAPSMRSRRVTWPALLAASGISAALGATVAIIVSNANTTAPTGTLAREIDALGSQIALLDTRAQQAAVDIVSMRSRLDAHSDRLRRGDDTDTQLRTDLAGMASQLSAVTGASNGATPDGASPNATPLGILLARINKLERIVADATAAPETTREVQRAIADLALQVAELDLANRTMVTAFDQREAALAALETGLQDMAGRIDGGAGAPALPSPRVSLATVDPPAAIVTATTRAQTIRALGVLEAAARSGEPFIAEHRALADLLPDDETLSEIAVLAETGAPTLMKLRIDFHLASVRALRHAEEESDDGWNWLRQSFAGVVTFAPSAQVALASDTIRSARRQLDVGEIREAVTAVSGVSGQAQQDFDAWREKALRRARLDETMKMLNTRLLAAATTSQGAG
jgi:hypothetical protein